ncbi:MAG: peptide-methionine (S)-S-oxide reductase MsrA [Halobacteriovoraceae bacterium]|nr:peptide-methionine (S)-S-oxide reductase MsrA [Halobacteriovoraceae bacterium]
MVAGGCFWGVEYLLGQLNGVSKAISGYAGGSTDNPSYREVCTGQTGHVEVVYLEFDPAQISYRDLLIHFFKLHDPTQADGQGVDIGSQYLSKIFTYSPQQEEVAHALKNEIEMKKIFSKPLATEILPAPVFWPAEEYHQKYFHKNTGYICHYYRDWEL